MWKPNRLVSDGGNVCCLTELPSSRVSRALDTAGARPGPAQPLFCFSLCQLQSLSGSPFAEAGWPLSAPDSHIYSWTTLVGKRASLVPTSLGIDWMIWIVCAWAWSLWKRGGNMRNSLHWAACPLQIPTGRVVSVKITSIQNKYGVNCCTSVFL